MPWKSYLQVIVLWAEEHDYIVDLDGIDNCICLESKIIELNANINDLEVKTYIALHEAGHILVRQSPGLLKLLSPKKREEKELTVEEKVSVILEETEAWKRGYKLGIRLKIPINLIKWETEQAVALNKYMKWVLKEY